MDQHSAPFSKFKNVYKFFKLGCYFTIFLKWQTCKAKETLWKLRNIYTLLCSLIWIESTIDQGDRIADVLSNKLKITTGFPQGSILGPVLFLIYVNNVDQSIRTGKVEDLEMNALIDVNLCVQFFSEFSLKTNYSKSSFIEFQLGGQNSDICSTVTLRTHPLENTSSTQLLWVLIDEGVLGAWGDHVVHVCAKMTSGIYALRNRAKFIMPLQNSKSVLIWSCLPTSTVWC